jgi:hypothetical protein
MWIAAGDLEYNKECKVVMSWFVPILVGAWVHGIWVIIDRLAGGILPPEGSHRPIALKAGRVGLVVWCIAAALLAIFTYGKSLPEEVNLQLRCASFAALSAFYFLPIWAITFWSWVVRWRSRKWMDDLFSKGAAAPSQAGKLEQNPRSSYFWPSLAAVVLGAMVLAYLSAQRIHRDQTGEWFWGAEGRYEFKLKTKGDYIMRYDTATGEITSYRLHRGQLIYQGATAGRGKK